MTWVLRAQVTTVSGGRGLESCSGVQGEIFGCFQADLVYYDFALSRFD
jgi:hypothetical protein